METNLEAELFSLDGRKRYHKKISTELTEFKKIGMEIGEALKKESKNSYKK